MIKRVNEIFSIKAVLLIIKFCANFLINIPITTGNVTTKNILIDIPLIEISLDR